MVSTTSQISTNPYNLYSNHIYPHQPANASKSSDETTNPYALYSNYTNQTMQQNPQMIRQTNQVRPQIQNPKMQQSTNQVRRRSERLLSRNWILDILDWNSKTDFFFWSTLVEILKKESLLWNPKFVILVSV